MTYTRELARIKAVQHKQIISRYGRKALYNPEPVSFENWFLKGLRFFESNGADFELLPGMVKITWPGRNSILRTVDDFKREYDTEYLSHF